MIKKINDLVNQKLSRLLIGFSKLLLGVSHYKTDLEEKKDLRHFKNEAFYKLAILFITIGIFPIFYGAYLFFLENNIIAGVLELLSYFVILILLLNSRISIMKKRYIFVLCIFLLGVMLLFIVGPMGAGLIVIFSAFGIAACLLNKRQNIIFIYISLLVFIVISVFLYLGFLDNLAIYQYRETWYIVAISTQSMGTLFVLIINNLFSNIEKQIEEREIIAKKNEFLANHDYLTGLYNRRFLDVEFEQRVRSGDFPVAFLLGNVDGFKTFNDAFGHSKGDEILIDIANRLAALIIDGGALARFGGDEFAILVSGKDEDEIRQYLDKLNREFNEDLEDSVKDVQITISWGYEIQKDEKDTLDDLHKEAEAFMNNRKFYNKNSLKSKTVNVIMETLFLKSEREKNHSERVGELCEIIARKMNFCKTEVDKIRVAGLLHDIGKIGIEEAVLNKAGNLDAKEWEMIKLHPVKSASILAKTIEYHDIVEIVLSHHERYDGKGYPNGLAGSDIPLMARIVAISDAYDAMTEQRTYRTLLSKEEAIVELKKCSGTQFDPKVVDVFVSQVLMKIKAN